jgi:lipoteichoic acid synthase
VKVGPLEGTSLGGYIVSMRYVDEAVEQFMTDLERKGLLKDTLVVIYGDHESKLKLSRREKTGAARALDLEPRVLEAIAKREWLAKKIPLFLVFPEGARSGTVERVGGQIDIGATILHYLGIRTPGSFFGAPLLGNDDGMAPHFNGAVASNEGHYQTEEDAKGECLDVNGSERPPAACDALRKRGAEAIELSLLVTMNDLARRLTEAVKGERAAAKAMQ